MKNSKMLDFVVGLFIIAALFCLGFLAYKVSQINKIGKDGTYLVKASFSSVSGLNVGSSVMMSGVKIGYVESIILGDDYNAKVSMLIDNKYNKLPQDSSASILTSGLLGEKYVGIDAGGFDEYLEDSGVIDLTKSSMVIERLIDRFLLNASTNKAK